jgi:hypothetical protein
VAEQPVESCTVATLGFAIAFKRMDGFDTILLTLLISFLALDALALGPL